MVSAFGIQGLLRFRDLGGPGAAAPGAARRAAARENATSRSRRRSCVRHSSSVGICSTRCHTRVVVRLARPIPGRGSGRRVVRISVEIHDLRVDAVGHVAIGISSTGTPGQRFCHIAREMRPCSRLTPLTHAGGANGEHGHVEELVGSSGLHASEVEEFLAAQAERLAKRREVAVDLVRREHVDAGRDRRVRREDARSR